MARPALATLLTLLLAGPAGALLSDWHEEEDGAGEPVGFTNGGPAAAAGGGVQEFDVLTDKDVAFCACDKCGTTSLYSFIYENTFGHPYHTPNAGPWVQDLYTWRSRWQGKFHKVYGPFNLSVVSKRIAVVRDPQERIFSAWKSKLACDEDVGKGMANSTDRQKFVPKIYRLANLKPVPYCISFEQFVDALKIIQDRGNLWKLQGHFLPQQYGCFRTAPYKSWTYAGPISDPRLMEEVAKALGVTPKDDAHSHAEMPHDHASPHVHVRISPRTRRVLNEITAPEYEALGDALPKERPQLQR